MVRIEDFWNQRAHQARRHALRTHLVAPTWRFCIVFRLSWQVCQMSFQSFPIIYHVFYHVFHCCNPFFLQVQLRVEIAPSQVAHNCFAKQPGWHWRHWSLGCCFARWLVCQKPWEGWRIGWHLMGEKCWEDRWKKNERISTKREGASRGFKFESSTSLQQVYNQVWTGQTPLMRCCKWGYSSSQILCEDQQKGLGIVPKQADLNEILTCFSFPLRPGGFSVYSIVKLICPLRLWCYDFRGPVVFCWWSCWWLRVLSQRLCPRMLDP